eukprot:jgi/Chrzof1/13121/Cz07g20190.t1
MLSNQEHINQLWRQQALAQRHLDNARVLWARVVEKNRRGVEEKAEQLRATAFTAALVAGFANVAFMQFDYVYDDPTGVVLPIFAASMALTISMETICIVICTLMLASITKTGQNYVSEEEEAEFMDKARNFALKYTPGDRPPAPLRSFATHWNQRCENSWRRAFALFGLGIPALFANLASAGWIKFESSVSSASIVTVICGVSLVFMMFFHRRWTSHILAHEQHDQGIAGIPLPPKGLPFDWHQRPVAGFRQASGLQDNPAVTLSSSAAVTDLDVDSELDGDYGVLRSDMSVPYPIQGVAGPASQAASETWQRLNLEQRHLDNARHLWMRVVETNRRSVEEKSEQLKGVSSIAALIAGFALAAFMQFNIGDPNNVTWPLFSITMALTIGLETISVVMCTLMFASIIKTGQHYISEDEEAEFLDKARNFALKYM